ncbi:MAG TPA: ATP-binding protein [Deltaproteobacteria bacterium]|nr:ATP-binding protein [Deltaproteobacteria bacterium]
MGVELPAWAEELRNRYLAGEASMFLLHGNVRDLHCWRDEGGKETWLDLRSFLERFLERTRDVIAYYNVSQGLQFTKKPQARLFRSIVDARRQMRGEERLGPLPVTAADTIPVIEDLITDPAHSSAVIVDYFEMIAPNADVAFMVHEDKANLVSLQRWSSDPAFVATDNLVILVCEHLSDISRRITSSAQLATIHITFPEVESRAAFILAQDLSEVQMEMEPAVLGKMTAGLSLVQIRNVLQSAALTKNPITFAEVSTRKKSIIEQECHGLVEFIPPRHDFSHVGGMERIKRDLNKIADAVKSGNRARVPMGMIFVGPMGTGKTFVAESFATESGLTCLKLKNFRDKWVGSTEANLEKVLDLVEALGYVLLVLDEADRGLSSGQGSDGGVNSRVIARLKEFMSDTSHRGRVVMLMMTNRPDKLDTDLKRPGRFDMKIPFFFPETAQERHLIFEALTRKNKLQVAEDLTFDFAVTHTDGFSGAELEAVLLAAAALAGDEDKDVIEQAHIDQASRDIIPSRDTRMLEYMEMLAVFECSAKRMLPQRYESLGTDEVQARLDQLRAQLGRRVL